MASRKPKAIDPTQTTISHVFAKVPKIAPSDTKTPVAAEVSPLTSKTSTTKLSSADSRVQAFYNTLTPREVIAHSIAVEKLGTSYDVTRTHGFLRWSKANPAT